MKWFTTYIDEYFTDPEFPSLSFPIVYVKLLKLWDAPRIYYAIPWSLALALVSQVIYIPFSGRPLHFFVNMFQTGFFHLGLTKLAFFFWNWDRWNKIIYWLSGLEREQLKDEQLKTIVSSYIKYNKRTTWYFWLCGMGTFFVNYGENFISVIVQMETTGVVDPTYVSFFWLWPTEPMTGGRLNVYLYLGFQFIYAWGGVSYLLVFDSMSVSVMMTLAGQLEVLRDMFRTALDEDTEEKQHESLIKCYKRYIDILDTHKLSNELMSPVLFLYLLVASINMSLILFSLPKLGLSATITSVELVASLIVEAFYYYWHGQQVLYQSEIISAAVYECDWVDKSAAIRRLVYIMSSTTDKRLIYQAGPFNDVTVATFISCVKVTYSFYKLMTTTVS
uniref:Odorant receptor n=1 Tax=Plutella xylostella TaxID=51655 RepID=A0A8G1GML2_PLUXY|nr:odorant receptor 35 [Plutella xylostella]